MTLPLLAQEIISLPLKNPADPSAPAEKIEERGKAGVIDRAITNVVQPTVTVYLPAKNQANGTGIVICPGGGYQHLAIDKEGHDIARWLNSIGIAAVVLKYRFAGEHARRPRRHAIFMRSPTGFTWRWRTPKRPCGSCAKMHPSGT